MRNHNSLYDFYNNKKIFITGHTGFKGAWMATWLTHLNAKVTGYSLAPKNIRGNMFECINIEKRIHKSCIEDICNFNSLQIAIKECEPEVIFHLAAQPLVLESYKNPIETFSSNVMGAINLLEIAKNIPSVKAVVVITTDKCYENKEWVWAYRENDRLGGRDPYSASKAMVEMATLSYQQSFFAEKNLGLATARAGNVIGGGDFAEFRIIPDIVEAISNKQVVKLRSPNSIRPWQHVMEALYGYILLGYKLYNNPKEFSTAFNFSSDDNSNEHTVEYIAKTFIKIIGSGNYSIENNTFPHEANLLRLDSSKTKAMLQWKPQLSTLKAIETTANWYKEYLNNNKDLYAVTFNQINTYMDNLIK